MRENIVEFVYSGGGLMGVHGTSVAFTKWPGAMEDWQEFGIMLGARGANHRESTEPVVSKIEDTTHPLVQVFKGNSFEFKDEYFRFPDVYSRERVRVLLSIDTNKTDLSRGNNIYKGSIRKDNDYAVAWVRSYGNGRVFYSTIAHNPYVFYDPIMLRFYLDAAQFALGDLKAPTTPSARLDERNTAFEKADWQVGIMDDSAVSIEQICKQAYNDKILFGGISYGTLVFDDSDVKFSPSMTPKEREKYRLMLDRYCIRINSCRLDKIPTIEQEADNLFEFLDIMGIENVILPDVKYDFKAIEKYCQKYGLKAAIECLNDKVNEKKLFAAIKNYGEQIGAALAINQKSLK
ncbi:MAG TPA: ThuA domain-containing protein, partial [Verrucomicrobiota bacterium]|nr:ThuA domain-containing protein [Verrucomicrobiota bacterium]